MRSTMFLEDWSFINQDTENGYLKELSDEKWQVITVPHDWAVSSPINPHMKSGMAQGFLDRWGIGWYRHKIWLDEKNGNSSFLLTFDGVFERSEVYVNEKLVGGKNYGYSGFTLDVTEYMTKGENLIAVRVDNSETAADRWYSGAGIYRKVYLTKVSETHLSVEDIVVGTDVAEGTIEVSVETGTNATTRVKLFWKDGVVAESVSDDGRHLMTFPKEDAHLWSAETPNLYDLEVSLFDGKAAVDFVTFRIGLRNVTFEPRKGLFINGKGTKLKGVCLHHDMGCVGTAVTKNLWRQRFEVLKRMGCNAIRTSHNVQSPEFMDLCDEMGFYVIDECFDKWDRGSYGRFFKDDWETDVSFMVKRDRNRPSVIIWSVGNEVHRQGSEAMCDILEMLVGKVKELDGSRPVSYGAMPTYWATDENVKAKGIDEILPLFCRMVDKIDIISLNYQEQWFEEFHAARPDKLIITSEAYCWFKASHSNAFSYDTENPWMSVKGNDYAIGSFLWSGVDYLGESMEYPSKGWCASPIRTNNEPRPAAKLFEGFWSDKPMVHLTMVDYSLRDEIVKEEWSFPPMIDSWNFPMYRRIALPYMIFTNCEEVELTVNGKRLDVRKPSVCENGIITGYITLQSGYIQVKGLNGGHVVCEHNIQTAGEAAKLEFLENRVFVGKGDYAVKQALVTVYAKDVNGTRCMREGRNVRFVVEGDGEIEGVDNGSLLCGDFYKSDNMNMLNGAVSVVIRTKIERGIILVRAYADGLLSGVVEINV